jgi:hypothetical protein
MVFRVDAVEGQRIDRLTVTFGEGPGGHEPGEEDE